ncbi:MAG: metalloregulator ArsR/SmtB family transcription factor [Bacillota bacterium]|nr:metalloregulator ArsR/SmtB family transcription factor [Bacillota bacterium]
MSMLCETCTLRSQLIHEILEKMPSSDEIMRLADFYKVLGDPTRLQILLALTSEERPVLDLAEAIEMSQSAVSHQLRILRQARLVRSRKDGKRVFYSLYDSHVHAIISQALDHISHT